MTVYSVVPIGGGREKLEESIKKLPTGDVYTLPGKAGWLVQFAGTSVEFCSALNIPTNRDALAKEDTPPMVLVSSLTSYYGIGPKEMWEWVRSREEA